MSKMIQIRHVPDSLHRKLTARAAANGMTLSDFLKSELQRLVAGPTLADIAVRLKSLEPIVVTEPVVKSLREARGAR